MKLILVGSSTGGPGHIEMILRAIPDNFNATIIFAQHINPIFSKTLVDSLSTKCKLKVRLIENSEKIENREVIFIKNSSIMRYKHGGLYLEKIDKETDYNPSINELFLSVAENMTHLKSVYATILTGIGDDGAKGLLELHKKGAFTVAESKESAIVFGMPRVAIEIGAVNEIMPISEIINSIVNFGVSHG